MNVSLTKPFNDFVQRKVNSWFYASASEVIREALRVLAEKEVDLEIDRKIKIWIAQADAWLGKELNDELVEKLLQSVKNRLSANKNKECITL